MADAVVLAAGRLPASWAAREGTDIKALLQVGGRTLLARVLGALRACPQVGRVAVAGPDELLAHSDAAAAHLRVPQAGSGPDNLWASIEALKPEGPVVCCASDLVHLSGPAVSEFLSKVPEGAEIAYAFSLAEAYARRYPGLKHMRVRLHGGVYTGGSVQLIDAEAVRRNMLLLNRVFAARKSKLAMAGVLGPVFLLRFALGRMSIEEIEAQARRLTGCAARGVLCDDPGLAFDIDEPEHLQWAREMEARGEG
jgi:GTP:adenosylcobinamide-phosphate guanylyltransferase